MSVVPTVVLILVLTVTAVHLLTIGLAALQCRRARALVPLPECGVGITLVRTIHDIDALEEETLRSIGGF